MKLRCARFGLISMTARRRETLAKPSIFQRIAAAWLMVALAPTFGGTTVLAQSPQSDDGESSSSMYEGSSSGEYGSGEGPAAPIRANLTTGPTPMAVWQLTQPDWRPLWQELGRVVASSNQPLTPMMSGPILRNEAHVAYRHGNLPLARELYFAHLALGDEDSAADLKSLQFSTYFRDPVWQLRWGASLSLHGDTEVTDFAPIRSGDNPNNGDMTGMMADYGSGESFGSPETSSYPGEETSGYSEEEMRGRGDEQSGRDPRMEGMEPGMDSRMGSGMSGMGGGYDDMGNPIPQTPVSSAPTASMTDPVIADRFDEVMGMVAETVAEGMQTRIASGQYGSALASVDPEGTDEGNTVGGEFVDPAERKMWIPGIVYLGEGSSQEMIKSAAQTKMDLLLHFDVALKSFRTGPPQNTTRVKVIDGRSGKTLILSGAMDSREVARLTQAKRGTAKGHVTDAMEKFWSILDSKLAVTAFPKITPEVARRRVSGLLTDSSLSMLRKLAEIRYLAANGYLNEEEVETAFDIAAGPEGVTVLHGTTKEKIATLRQIALREAKSL